MTEHFYRGVSCNGYKYYGKGGYTIHLRMRYGFGWPDFTPPEKVTKDELEELKKRFDNVFEFPRGGLFV